MDLIQTLAAQLNELLRQRHTAAEVQRLLHIIAELRAALRPFADITIPNNWLDDEHVSELPISFQEHVLTTNPRSPLPTVGEFRIATDVYTRTSQL